MLTLNRITVRVCSRGSIQHDFQTVLGFFWLLIKSDISIIVELIIQPLSCEL